jgi:hypothetical protein
MNEKIIISGAVEGIVDEAALRTLIGYVGATAGPVFGKSGKNDLKKRLLAYNNAAKFQRWTVLIDLDHEDDCPLRYKSAYLESPSPLMCFRIVVREIEAWLLADRGNIAEFLSVPLKSVPFKPESLDNRDDG